MAAEASTGDPALGHYGSTAELTLQQRRAIADTVEEAADVIVLPADRHETVRADFVDAVRDRALATPADPRAASPLADYVDTSGDAQNLVVTLFDQAFAVPPDEDQIGGVLEYGYLSAGWNGVDEARSAIATALKAQLPANADALSRFMVQKVNGIGLLAGDYLLQLEIEADRLLGLALDERLGAIGVARKALLGDNGGVVALSHDDDGALTDRARRLVADLKEIKQRQDDVREITALNAPFEEQERMVKRLVDYFIPFSNLRSAIADLPDGPDTGDVTLLGPLAALASAPADFFDELLKEPRKQLAAAVTILAHLRKEVIKREPVALCLLVPAGADIPVDEALIAKGLDAGLTRFADATKALMAKRAAGALSAMRARVVIPGGPATPIFSGGDAMGNTIIPPEVTTGADYIGIGTPGTKPEVSLARLLIARPRDGIYLPRNIWNMGPVVRLADRNLRAKPGADASPLTPVVYASLQQEIMHAGIIQGIEDLAFGLFIAIAEVASGPAGMVLLAISLMLDVADMAATTWNYQIDTTIADSDALGMLSSMRSLMDTTPDLVGVIAGWLGVVAGGVGLAGGAVKGASTLAGGLPTLDRAVPAMLQLSHVISASGFFVAMAGLADGLDQAEAAP